MSSSTPLSRLLTPLFAAFEQAGVDYCVLRGYARLPEETRNDVDLAIEPAAAPTAEQIVRRVSRETGWLVVGRTTQAGFLRLNVFHPQHPGGVLPLDLCSEHSVWGMLYADAAVVLHSSLEHAGLRVARPGCEAAVSLLKGITRHGVVKTRDDYRARLQECLRLDPDGFRECSAALLGDSLCEELIAAGTRGRWDEIERLAGRVRSTLSRRSGRLRVALAAVRSGVRTRLRKHSRRNGLEFRGGLFLCLLGPDGSGKTTFSRAIEERIGGLFATTEQFHSLAGLLPKLKGLKKVFYAMRGKAIPDSPLKGLAQPGVVAKPMPALQSSSYIVYYGIEYILYRLSVRRKLRRNHLVIFDRYFYDYYLMRVHLNAPRWLLGLFGRLIAQPDALLIMLADPEAIFRRKPELTAEEIQRQQDILKRLALPTGAHIDTSISIERTVEEALDVIGPRLLGEPPPASSVS
jgi:thymidylate kinase